MRRKQHPRILEWKADDPSGSGRSAHQRRAPAVNDSTFATGKTGFWTAGDTVAYFADTRIEYTAARAVDPDRHREVMKKNSSSPGLESL